MLMAIACVRALMLFSVFTLTLAPLANAEDRLQSLTKKQAFEILYFEPLPPLTFVEYQSGQSTLERNTTSPAWEWSMEAFGKHFHFHLKQNNRLFAKLPKSKREKIAEHYEFYRGKIEGNEESWIRLTKIGDQWSGMMWDGEELYVIDSMKVISPSLRTIPLPGQFKQGIYRLSDTRHLEEAACGVGSDGIPHEPLSDFQALSEELQETISQSAVGASFNIDIAIVTDPLFAEIQQNNFGTAPDAAVLARMNVVDGIYSEQVGVQLNLVEILELSNNGTLTATDSATLLSQFGNFTNSSSFTHPGVAHLFTGRDIDGNTIGRAYVGSLCSARFGVGINEIRQGGTIGSVLFAHELGHNFGAPHDNQSGSACASTPGNFIMSPIINNSEEFSQCSLQQMQPEVNSASCLTVIDPTNTDPSVTILSPQDGALLSASNPIPLVGEATDLEDGDLSSQIEWTSDLDGPIGTGGNISPTLQVGTHRITARVEDTDNGAASEVIIITVAEDLDGLLLFESHFDNNGTDGFGYVDDAFRNTSEPTFADGTHEPDQGFSGGGLRVALGGINDADITDMSGGWARSFNLDTAGEVIVALRYKLTQASDYENDELSQALLAMDGTLVGSDNNDYLTQLVGDGNGGNAQTTDWVPVVVNLGILTTGPHTLVVGAYNNKKTWPNETTEILIDDVVVRHIASGPPPPQSNSPTVSITSPTDGESFSDGAIIAFVGQASDLEDGDLTTNLVWSSNLDGGIGTGGNFSTSLSLGTHTITAQVSDSSGLSTSQTITLGVVATSPPPTGTLLIEDFADGNFLGWSVFDEGTISAPSAWSAATGTLIQTSNIYSGSSGPSNSLPVLGTYARYDTGFAWTDYAASLTLRSDDDDALGVMIRYQDANNYYRFSWDRQRTYRRLVKVHNGVFTLLAKDAVPYVKGQSYQLALQAEGETLTVRIDGSTIFTVTDSSLASGTIALYTWGNQGSHFDDIRVTPPPPPPTGTLLIEDFTDGNFLGWSVIDDGTISAPSAWSAATGTLIQTSNIYSGSSGPSNSLPVLGTYARYDTGFAWTDYAASLTLRSDDDDALGIMIRYQDANNYYRFSWDRQRTYRRLVKVHNGVFTLLAEDAVPYVKGQSYQLALQAEGETLTVRIDGGTIFTVTDSSLASGTVALYSWGNQGSHFDDLRVTPPNNMVPAGVSP